jgi:predicted ABC-type ATPase
MPKLFVIAGPNGAGKSTAARALVPNFVASPEFVNADEIAKGLSGFRPESVAWQAGRLMLARLSELAQSRVDFAFETTLASRSFAPWLRERQLEGYEVNLLYFWLPSVAMAIARVRSRVRAGGHHVPEEDVRRRYERSRTNFLQLYMPLANTWEVYDNSAARRCTVAYGGSGRSETIVAPAIWQNFIEKTA